MESIRSQGTTLATLHAVQGGVSAAVLVELTPVSAMSHELMVAVWCFAIALPLNVFCYLLAAGMWAIDPWPKNRLLWFAALLITVLPVIAGFAAVVSHFSCTAGVLFLILSILLILPFLSLVKRSQMARSERSRDEKNPAQ